MILDSIKFFYHLLLAELAVAWYGHPLLGMMA